ncbi:MAG: DHH family phosphoesterase [Planctomycetes bacterium]|nr:DHH family phosphoesterase [Planctomycetota bacterium]
MRFRVPPDPAARPNIRAILAFLRDRRRFLLTTHLRVDGDALGSEIALARMLAKLGKSADIVNEDPVPAEFRFLPGADAVAHGRRALHGPYDAMIVVDSGTYPADSGLRRILPPDLPILNIDHHTSNDRFGTLNWVAPSLGSVGEMIYRLCRGAGVALDPDMALGLYVSMVTDTGRFSFSNTSAYAHLIAAELLGHGIDPGRVTNELYGNKSLAELRLQAETIRGVRLASGGRLAWFGMTRALFRRCGVEPGDPQEYVNLLKSVRGVKMALLFREVEEPGKVRVSIRSESGYDASVLAQAFGGGGHRRAAGCTCDGRLADVSRRVLARARRIAAAGAQEV